MRVDITATQQGILREVYETDDISGVPQMWCMYKEVAEYFVNGVSDCPGALLYPVYRISLSSKSRMMVSFRPIRPAIQG